MRFRQRAISQKHYYLTQCWVFSCFKDRYATTTSISESSLIFWDTSKNRGGCEFLTTKKLSTHTRRVLIGKVLGVFTVTPTLESPVSNIGGSISISILFSTLAYEQSLCLSHSSLTTFSASLRCPIFKYFDYPDTMM